MDFIELLIESAIASNAVIMSYVVLDAAKEGRRTIFWGEKSEKTRSCVCPRRNLSLTPVEDAETNRCRQGKNPCFLVRVLRAVYRICGHRENEWDEGISRPRDREPAHQEAGRRHKSLSSAPYLFPKRPAKRHQRPYRNIQCADLIEIFYDAFPPQFAIGDSFHNKPRTDKFCVKAVANSHNQSFCLVRLIFVWLVHAPDDTSGEWLP